MRDKKCWQSRRDILWSKLWSSPWLLVSCCLACGLAWCNVINCSWDTETFSAALPLFDNNIFTHQIMDISHTAPLVIMWLSRWNTNIIRNARNDLELFLLVDHVLHHQWLHGISHYWANSSWLSCKPVTSQREDPAGEGGGGYHAAAWWMSVVWTWATRK